MEELTISSQEFKALSSDNRTKMLKLLVERNHTLTEISKKIGISSPSSKQHLDVLKNAQLVELLDEGRKWKYYSLTRKGKKILHSKENQTQVFILLSVASIAFIGVLGLIFFPFFGGVSMSAGVESVPLIDDAAKENEQLTTDDSAATPPESQRDGSIDGSTIIPASEVSDPDTQVEDPVSGEKETKQEPEPEIYPEVFQDIKPDQSPLIILAVVLGMVVAVLFYKYTKLIKIK